MVEKHEQPASRQRGPRSQKRTNIGRAAMALDCERIGPLRSHRKTTPRDPSWHRISMACPAASGDDNTRRPSTFRVRDFRPSGAEISHTECQFFKMRT